MAEIKVGYTVKLKSGGPVMSVEAITGTTAKCVWFDDNTPMERVFDCMVLKRYLQSGTKNPSTDG